MQVLGVRQGTGGPAAAALFPPTVLTGAAQDWGQVMGPCTDSTSALGGLRFCVGLKLFTDSGVGAVDGRNLQL